VSLRYALLALLNVGPMTGYDLCKAFESSVGHVWYAPDSQIYPELRRMERDGMIKGEPVPWGERGTKRLYHVTDDGVTAFESWMNDTLEYSRVRDPAHLKAAYFEWADPDSARVQLLAHIAHHSELLAHWHERVREIDDQTNPMLKRRLERTPDPFKRRTIAFKRFAYEGLIGRSEQEIAWAERGLRLLKELVAADGGWDSRSRPVTGGPDQEE
jgi:PadR family transcriptional regulator, regulatory protein AphA